MASTCCKSAWRATLDNPPTYAVSGRPRSKTHGWLRVEASNELGGERLSARSSMPPEDLTGRQRAASDQQPMASRSILAPFLSFNVPVFRIEFLHQLACCILVLSLSRPASTTRRRRLTAGAGELC